MTLGDYIASRVQEDGDCLRWTGYLCNGHPGGTINGEKVLIRRALWLRHRGPIPAGKVLRCTCETDLCINLEHVEAMTYRKIGLIEGAAGKMSGPIRSAKIAAVKRAGKQARITQDEARAIRISEETSTVLSRRHGLSVSTICRIKNGVIRREFAGNVWQGLGCASVGGC